MNDSLTSHPAGRTASWCFAVVCLAGMAAGALTAQDAPGLQLTEPAAPSKNRLGLSARFGFNVKVRFQSVPGFPPQTALGPPSGGAIDRFYDDGYVGVDNTGNAGGLTAFWGYQREAQATAADLAFHGATPIAGDTTAEDEMHPGFELTYARQIGLLGRASWGVEAGFGYTSLDVHDSTALAGNVTLTTDRYAHGLGAPPLASAPAPYAGARNSVAPLISDTPTRSVSSTPATVVGSSRIEADLYGFRVGPYARLSLSRRVSLQLGGGFAAALVDSTLSFDSTTLTDAGGGVPRAGRGSTADWLLGAYAAGQVSVRLARDWDAFAGVQYQHLGRFEQTVSSMQTEIDLRNSLFATAGVGFSF